jgi:hypothetical protein
MMSEGWDGLAAVRSTSANAGAPVRGEQGMDSGSAGDSPAAVGMR